MTAGMISKIANNTEKITDKMYNKNKLNEYKIETDSSQIGIATNWVNPFITRYKKPETTTKRSRQLYGTKKKYLNEKHLKVM